MLNSIPDNPGTIDQFSFRDEEGWHHNEFSNGFIEPDGTYVEREYQAAKALKSEDAARILACEKPFGPGGSKQMGRSVEKRPDWDQVKFQAMARFVLNKFLDHESLAQKLLSTGDALIIEGNTWHDNTWGDCRCGGREECEAPGLNWLGHILMTSREAVQHTITR